MRLYFNATLFFYFCYFSTLCAQPIKQKNTFVDSTSIIYKNNKTENSKTKPATPKNKTASFLFKSYQNGIFQKNGCNYIIAKPEESALSVAERAKIPYYKLLKYNDLQDEDMLIAYQYMYLENKKSIFKQEVAFFKVENDETLYEIAQFFGIKLADLQKRNGLYDNEEVENGELILLTQQAVSRPKIRNKNDINKMPKVSFIAKKDTILLQPIKADLNPKEFLSATEPKETSTYPAAIYQQENHNLISIPTSKNQLTNKVPNNKNAANHSLFGLPALEQY